MQAICVGNTDMFRSSRAEALGRREAVAVKLDADVIVVGSGLAGLVAGAAVTRPASIRQPFIQQPIYSAAVYSAAIGWAGVDRSY